MVMQLTQKKLAADYTAQQAGLTKKEAAQRLSVYGANEPVKTRRTSIVVQFLRFFAEPLVIILMLASLISAFVGDWINAGIIVMMVLLSVVLDFIQTARSQKATENLRREIAPTAIVLRDGNWSEIARREIVPGDIIRLTAGNLVPADATLLEARDLHVQEAALTGESLPVEKEISPISATDTRNKVLLGTSVISGNAIAQVTATGAATAFGSIAERLAAKPPETEFERGTKQFGLLIARVVIFLVLFVFLINTALKRDPLESFLFSIALAVGLTPEFLPMITTVTLGQGALRMARRKVVVKHLAALQNFGSIDILCSDKTGTLTSGEMSLDQHLDPFGSASERPFLLAYLNSLFETGIQNPLDTAIKQKANANPLDTAILIHDHPDVKGFTKFDEIPFDFERRRMSVVAARENKHWIITKGAPESVLSICDSYEINANKVSFDDAARKKCEALFHELSAQGYRTLAVASAEIPTRPAYNAQDEKELVFAGFLTFSDHPLDTAAETLAALANDGVQVKILTGDNELVARHVCSQVGLNAENIVLGDEVDRMTDTALAHIAEQTTVFARVSPMQKNRILTALRHRGHVVGFMGDGINDAPSLRAADVGISVATGTDVARDAAEVILLEQSLRVLHEGILAGRKAFGNVMKYLLMGTSSNFGNMFSMAGAALFLPFLPMLPTQILLNNFLYDLAQVTIPTDNVDETFIQKPHRWDIKMIRNFMIWIGPISSVYDFLTFYILLKFFSASEQFFHTGWFVESLATQTLVIFIIRTAGNPLKSRPSLALTTTTLLVVLTGAILPFTPLAQILGFVPLPLGFFLYLGITVGTYLLFVELVKSRLMRHLLG